MLRGAEVALLGAAAPGTPAGRGGRGGAAAGGGMSQRPRRGQRGGPGGAPAFPRTGGARRRRRGRRGRCRGGAAGAAVAAGVAEAARLRLNREPALAALASAAGELGTRATALLARIEWPGKPGAAAPVTPLTPAEQARFAAGQTVYQSLCQRLSSAGRPRSGEIAPSLVGSRLALAPARIPARILINGKEGKVGLMPPLGEALTDEQIAAVLTYVRREWGQTASPVDLQNSDGYACSYQGPCAAVDR